VSGQITREMIDAAIRQINEHTYEPTRLEPMHPADYAYIQRDLDTTEPLTEQQVIDWAISKFREGLA
jgi:hypothetical protein